MSKHTKGCELGDNHKDCPACLELSQSRPMSKHKKVKAERVKAGVLPRLLSAKIDRFILPADAASYDAMVVQARQALHARAGYPANTHGDFYSEDARAALAAIGITRPPTKESK